MVTKCANCKYIQFCRLDRTEKMHGRKCWIDEIAERGKYKPQKVLSVCLDVEKSIGIGVADVTNNIIAICGESDVFEKNKEYWRHCNQPQKHKYIKYYVNWLIAEENEYSSDFVPPSEKDINNYTKIFLEIIDCICDSHRDGEMVTCLRCGELILNNSRHNRQHCDWCKGYNLQWKKWKICPDCGDRFQVEAPNNRQFRCADCQEKANKVATKLRVQRHRERKKCNDNN